MENKFKLGVIGAGYMASSIINGAVDSGFLGCKDVLIFDAKAETLKLYREKGFYTAIDCQQIFDDCQFVLISVKPQNFDQVCSCVKVNSNPVIISIMAGVSSLVIKDKLSVNNVVRCMPNAPCAVSNGAIGVDFSSIDAHQVDFVKNLFSSVAKVIEVDESMLNVVTGISGSAPAYFYLFAKGLIDSAVKMGMSFENAKDFVVNTMIGSGKMLLQNPNVDIDKLIDSVCSKGGTTIEAIKVYNQSGLNDISEKAVSACVKRAEELEKL